MRADKPTQLSPLVSSWHDEYVYRHSVVPGLSHEQFMDEPGDSIKWMTHIHALYQAEEARRNK